MANTPSVLLVEDHRLLRLSLKYALERLGGCRIVGEAEDGEAAVIEARRLQPDIVLMDVGLPGIDGIEATWRIKLELPRTRIIMLTSHTQPDDIMAALGAGADGYCIKETPIEHVGSAIIAVTRGEVWLDPSIAEQVMRSRAVEGVPGGVYLSETELEILALVREGIGNQEIASELSASNERVARVMGNIINRFMAKANQGQSSDRATQVSATQWLTGLAPDAQIETVFADKYLVGEKLGSGGIGSVFKAKHILMDRYVALKRIRPELSEDRLAVRNFHREAMAIANLHHKNIVEVYDFGIGENNEAFMVMEYVAGTNLADILQSEHRLPLERVVHFGAQICSGMEAAHEKGIVHCDLKPSNILISGDRHKETVKLVDFGLAQMMTRELDDQLQQTGKFYVSGTPYYMAPEQCAGRQLDARTDIYSLGCLLFESLTGQTVFKGKTATATFEKHCQMTPPSMAEAYPQGLFSASFERTIAGMLAKDAAHRPQTMSEVRSLLLGAIAGNQFSGSVLGVCRI